MDAEVQSQPRPLPRKPHPGRSQHPFDVVDPQCRGDQTTDDDTHHWSPEAQQRRAAEGKGSDYSQGGQRGQGRSNGLSLRRIVQQCEDDGGEGDGEYHHHCAAHSRRDDAPQNEQPLGDGELDRRRDEDQGRQRCRPSIRHRRDAERDGEGGREHWQDGPPPIGPTRRTCSSVDTPTTTREAKTIHTR